MTSGFNDPVMKDVVTLMISSENTYTCKLADQNDTTKTVIVCFRESEK